MKLYVYTFVPERKCSIVTGIFTNSLVKVLNAFLSSEDPEWLTDNFKNAEECVEQFFGLNGIRDIYELDIEEGELFEWDNDSTTLSCADNSLVSVERLKAIIPESKLATIFKK